MKNQYTLCVDWMVSERAPSQKGGRHNFFWLIWGGRADITNRCGKRVRRVGETLCDHKWRWRGAMKRNGTGCAESGMHAWAHAESTVQNEWKYENRAKAGVLAVGTRCEHDYAWWGRIMGQSSEWWAWMRKPEWWSDRLDSINVGNGSLHDVMLGQPV